MKSVFASAEWGSKPTHDKEAITPRVRAAVSGGGWTSTTQIHNALNCDVPRKLVHEILAEMLEAKEIKMRVIGPGSRGGRPRTEFRIMTQNAEVSGAGTASAGLQG